MFPIASQFHPFESGNGKFLVRNGDNDANRSARRTQFEIENILKNSSNDVTCTIASGFIEKNSSSLLFAFDQVLIDLSISRKLSVFAQSDGVIVPYDPMHRNKFWLKNVKIADDIPGANVLLHFQDDKIVLKAIKDINMNDELLMWFSEEVLTFMGIPFLVPGNIQGQTKYVCHHCCRVYENPNSLKLHLARNCDQFDENVIWKRLQAELLSRHQRKLMIHSRNFEHMSPFQPSVMIQPTSSSSLRLSAFQPVPKCGNSPSPPISHMPLPNLAQSTVNDSAMAAAAHLETIVSNMGTTKQGHLCIYCGKLYSRKYGLKIHIRTHSGFKPLKCKFCFRPFGDPSNLNKHIRLHTQSTDHHHHNNLHSTNDSAAAHKCHICNKNFLKRRDLQRHIQLKHSGPSSGMELLSTSGQEDSQMTLLSPSSSSSNEETEDANC